MRNLYLQVYALIFKQSSSNLHYGDNEVIQFFQFLLILIKSIIYRRAYGKQSYSVRVLRIITLRYENICKYHLKITEPLLYESLIQKLVYDIFFNLESYRTQAIALKLHTYIHTIHCLWFSLTFVNNTTLLQSSRRNQPGPHHTIALTSRLPPGMRRHEIIQYLYSIQRNM